MLDWLIPSAWAQGNGQAPAGSGLVGFLMPLSIIAIFYFIVWRPQQRRMREHQAMVQALQKGDQVITSGGIHGRIHAVEDRVLTVEIAPGVRIRVQKDNVAGRIAPTGEAKITEPK